MRHEDLQDLWLPIETAPKDGTKIILFFPKFGTQVGEWERQQFLKKPKPFWTCDAERYMGIRYFQDNPPTHWMPMLPKPKDVS